VRKSRGSTEKNGRRKTSSEACCTPHLDAPWRPRDIERREGMNMRRTTAKKEVQNSVTSRNVRLPSTRPLWQHWRPKGPAFIQQVMCGRKRRFERRASESRQLSLRRKKAIASPANPLCGPEKDQRSIPKSAPTRSVDVLSRQTKKQRPHRMGKSAHLPALTSLE